MSINTRLEGETHLVTAKQILEGSFIFCIGLISPHVDPLFLLFLLTCFHFFVLKLPHVSVLFFPFFSTFLLLLSLSSVLFSFAAVLPRRDTYCVSCGTRGVDTPDT